MAQVEKADVELFRLIGDAARDGIVQQAIGTYPLEAELDKHLDGARIQQILANLPLARSKAGAADAQRNA